MSNAIISPALPSAMEEKLRSIRRRHALLVSLRAVATGASVLVGAMLATMILDWCLTLFDTGIRTTLTTVSLGAAIVALIATGLRPLIEALHVTHAAASADEEIPQLEERWTTVASFAESQQQPDTKTGRAMLQQVTSEAVAMGRLVKPAQVARPTSLKPAVTLLGASLLVLGVFLAINWPQTSVLMQRFWSPTVNITATQLNSITGDIEVPRGEDVKLVAELAGVPRSSATLEVVIGDEIFDSFELEPDENRASTFAYEMAADQAFRYRVLAGDGKTKWHSVSVIDFPELGEVKLTVTAPEYVDRPKYEKSLIPSRVRVIQGSRLELQMKPKSPVEKLELAIAFEGSAKDPDAEIVRELLALKPDAEGWYRFETQLLEDMSLSPTLVNRHGLQNEDKRVCRIQVIPDKAPVARIISPNNEMAVAFDDVIPVEFEAHDDEGIVKAELVVEEISADGKESKILSVQEIDLGDQKLQKHVMGTAELDLKKLGVKEGANITYSIRVTDNRMVQIDPKAMRPQSSEAKPGDPNSEGSDAETRMAETDHDGQKVGEKSDDGDAHGKSEMLLADAGKRTDDRTRDIESSPGASQKGSPSESDSDKSDSSTSSSSESNADSADPMPGDSNPATNEGTDKESTDPTNLTDGDAKTESPGNNKSDTESRKGGPGENSDNKDGDKSESDENDTNGNPAKGADESAEKKDSETAVASTTDGNSDNSDSKNRPVDGDSDAGGGVSNSKDARSSEDAENARNMLAMLDGASKSGMKDDRSMTDREQNSAGGGSGSSRKKDRDGDDSEKGAARRKSFRMTAQRSDAGQDTQTRKRRLKITARLSAVAAADDRKKVRMEIRDRVIQIDRMLERVESALIRVVEREIPDADRSEQFRRLDAQLGDVEKYIADLRTETRDHQFAFVGLQMVDIGRTHVTPARDRVFVGIREPLGARHAMTALQHVDRARELLAALLKRYDRVARDKELAEALEESVKMYEVYIEKTQRLMREARQNRNPLKRKMAVIEVDQEYLDRYAEVMTLRREMMAEFARILGDDPRLLARYLDLIKRRRNSVRDQLSELSERQDEISTELSSWLQVEADQREDFWMIVAEMRLHSSGPLAKDSADFAERIEKQMPLILEADRGTAALIIEQAHKVSGLARTITFDVKKWIRSGLESEEAPPLNESAEQLIFEISELDAALDQLNFENEDTEEVTTYVTQRLLESRAVADQADAWSQFAEDILAKKYHGLAEVDQLEVALGTELLRIDMLGFEEDIESQFQQQVEAQVPGEIIDMIRELHFVMETITFNQTAATFGMTKDDLALAETQQIKALDGFDRAQKLFDKIRKAVVKELDKGETQNPDINNLRDPTLDEFLARLEREPNIEAQLGIPNRPRNLRVIADTMTWQTRGGVLLGDSKNAARRRARDSMRMQKEGGAGKKKPEKPEDEMTEEEREERERQRKMQEMLEKSLAQVQEKIDDPKTSEKQRRQLQEMAKKMQRMADDANSSQHRSATDDWERIVEAEKAKEVLRLLAAGERLPDSQWNKLLSTLDDGLWQVRGRTPPEDYQKVIEQYQDRLRELMDTVGAGAD